MKPAIAEEALGGPAIFSRLTGLRLVDIDREHRAADLWEIIQILRERMMLSEEDAFHDIAGLDGYGRLSLCCCA